MSESTVLITGDIVLDCHLYGDANKAATPFREPGTQYIQELGGAVLTRHLLTAAADADGLAWSAIKEQWERENAKRVKAGEAPLPEPKALKAGRPPIAYDVRLDLDIADLQAKLPPHLCSYDVWAARPAKTGAAKDPVWRLVQPFGYGSTEPARQSGVFRRAEAASADAAPLTLIDDGGILFRQSVSKDVWPVFEGSSGRWFLLKMSWPLCRGDLWAAIEPARDRLIVVVSAADIRRGDVQINPRLSWEQCVEHTIQALRSDPTAGDLLEAAHVIISYESEGALWFERGSEAGGSTWRLLFSHDALEGDHARQFEGTASGFQTCFTVGIAHRLMAHHAAKANPGAPGPFGDRQVMCEALKRGIASGLATRRLLLEIGHGPVGGETPGVPIVPLGRCAADTANKQGGFVLVEVPDSVREGSGCQWTILGRTEAGTGDPAASLSPLTGLAQLTALHGTDALSDMPALRMGGLFTVDRSEIESLRILDAIVRDYERGAVQNRPLSIGVFGPPGAGKSFGVKALARAVLGDKSQFLEFNLSQFKGPDELIGAFHRVRDAVLRGTTPVAFWDEFDSQQYRWLQYLLAPMQDGTFQDGQINHPIGKCVFVFAGGTSPALEAFGVAEPEAPNEQALAELSAEDRAERRRVYRKQHERYREYVLLKGPDFVSRLHGFLNVLGPNPRVNSVCPDITWPIRRALILRGILRLKPTDTLDVDLGLLHALLAVPNYRHGARSFEKIVNCLDQGRLFGRLNRSALPPRPLLGRETDAEAFHALLAAADEFKKMPDLEALAAAIHQRFLDEAEKTRLATAMAANPERAWVIHPAIMKSYSGLDADSKASNRAAARRIPDHLALIGYVVEPQREGDSRDWQRPLAETINRHVERLAQAEHLGWCSERRANGWSYARERDNVQKHHPLLVEWSALGPTDQDKDRSSVRAIPDLLVVAGFKAVPMKQGA